MSENINSRSAYYEYGQEKKREAEHRLNCAMAVIGIGFLAEMYLLFLYNYLIKGSVHVALVCVYALEVLRVVGAALLLLALALWFRKRKETALTHPWRWIGGVGAFFCFSSHLMLMVYPGGTVAMCVIVPVLTILGIIYLLYPRDFFVQCCALMLAIAASYALYRGITGVMLLLLVRAYSCIVAALCLVALLFVLRLRKHDGVMRWKGREISVFPTDTNYLFTLAVLPLSAAATVLSLLAAGFAFYVLWVLVLVLLGLAVYYTVRAL